MVYDYYITPEEYERAASYGVDAFTLERRVRTLIDLVTSNLIIALDEIDW